jgi:hypothetical protein
LNPWLCACKACALWLEPHIQSFLFWLFWRWVSNCLGCPRTATLLILTFQVARITGTSHWNSVRITLSVQNFYLDWGILGKTSDCKLCIQFCDKVIMVFGFLIYFAGFFSPFSTGVWTQKCLLGRHSTTGAPLFLLYLVFRQSLVFAGWSQTAVLLTYSPLCSWGHRLKPLLWA